MSRATILLVLALGGGSALAQTSVQWRDDAQRAVQEAQTTKRPLMVYVRGSLSDIDDKIKHAHRDAFQHPRIVQLSGLYVPLRLSRSGDRDVLDQFHFSQTANLIINFVSPTGEELGTISAVGIGNVQSLAEKMLKVFETFTTRLFDAEIRPMLDDQNSTTGQLQDALQVVGRYRIERAENTLVGMLDRPRLDNTVRNAIYDVLAALSTPSSVDALLKLAQQGDARAGEALKKCTPVGAELLLRELDADAEIFPYGIYEAVAASCNIRKTKPERWFERVNAKLRQQEVDRVSQLVHQTAEQWRAQYAIGR